MAKYCGKIGFSTTFEDPSNPGVWKEQILERTYYGDIVKNSRRWQTNGDSTNDNIEANMSLSIIADDFVSDNLAAIRYVNWMGANWKVSNVDFQLPRLVLQLGGVYNA